MTDSPVPHLHAITGAFGYTGKYIAARLLDQNQPVITLTGNPDRPNPFNGRVKAYPFHFDNIPALEQSLRGVSVLYNTYWVRFPHGQANYAAAIENTRRLIQAAKNAGVRRLVHVSITNPSTTSGLPYFQGKAILEQEIINSGLSYAILRPTVIFGKEDILINNMAYLLRRFPMFAIPGKGDYRLQPIYVDDMAALAVQAGQSMENQTIEAIGPETFRFDDLVRLIARTVHSRSRLIHLPPSLAFHLSRVLSILVRDVLLTQDELEGLMQNLLFVDAPPAAQTPLSEWLAQNAESLGGQYASELNRHYRR